MIDVVQLLIFSTPVALAALGETVYERTGQINIGLEGMMVAGAYGAMAVTLATGNPGLGLMAGVGAGLLLMLLQGFFTLQLAQDQVVTGTAINLLALGLTGTLFRAQFGQSGQLLSLPALPKVVGGLDIVVMLTLALVPLTALLIRRTGWGLAARAAGEYPVAAEASGFSVLRLRLGASMVAGACAGLAGAYLALGVANSFAEGMTAGRGFVAIAMVTFGRWRPAWVFAACLLVGYADSLQFTFQVKGTALPHQFFIALPYLLALLVLVVVGRGGKAPAALGIPFRRGR